MSIVTDRLYKYTVPKSFKEEPIDHCIVDINSDLHYQSHSSGPNIFIELNFRHAQQLCGFLQEFEGAKEKFRSGQGGAEAAMYELFANLKYVIDRNING